MSHTLLQGMGKKIVYSGPGGMRGGLLNRFRLSVGWATNLYLRFAVLETTVSNEGNHGKAFSALVGVTYKFKIVDGSRPRFLL